MKKIVIAILLSLILFTGCGKTKYIVGYINDYPPYILNKDGEFLGLYKDIFMNIGEKQNIDIKMKKYTKSDLEDAISNGKINAVITSNITDKGYYPKEYNTTNEFLEVQLCLAAKNYKPKVSDLFGKKVGMLKNSMLSKYMNENRQKYAYAIITYKNVDDLIKGLNTGDVDIIAEDPRVINYILNFTDCNIGEIKKIDNKVVLGVFDNNFKFIDSFNKGLVDIINSGIYNNIINRYK